MDRSNTLRPLIEHGQKLMIDAHGHEKDIHEFGDKRFDIHLHKKTPYRYKGRQLEVNIRLSLNSDRPAKITDKYNNEILLPRELEREIIEVFEDIELRNRFIKEMMEVLANYYHYVVEEDSAREILRRVSSYFGLDWSDYIVQFYVNNSRRDPIFNSYKAIIIDKYRAQIFELKMNFLGFFLEELFGSKKNEIYVRGERWL